MELLVVDPLDLETGRKPKVTFWKSTSSENMDLRLNR
jgi:hypothetical protein